MRTVGPRPWSDPEGLRIALDLVYTNSGKSHVGRRTRELGRQGERLREDVEVVHEEIRTLGELWALRQSLHVH